MNEKGDYRGPCMHNEGTMAVDSFCVLCVDNNKKSIN